MADKYFEFTFECNNCETVMVLTHNDYECPGNRPIHFTKCNYRLWGGSPVSIIASGNSDLLASVSIYAGYISLGVDEKDAINRALDGLRNIKKALNLKKDS